jgi:hypothetical protein
MGGTTYFLWVQNGDNNMKVNEPNWKEHIIKNT